MEDPDDINQDDTDSENINSAESPAVQGEKDPFSGNMPEESHDIDEEMGKIGKDINPEDPKPLGE